MMTSFRKGAPALRRCGRGIGNLVRRAVGVLGRPGQGRAAVSVTASRVAADLEQLNHATEKDFLAVGGKLHEFLSIARQTSSDMGSLIELFSGAQAQQVSQALGRMLERAAGMGARIEQNRQALATVQSLARRVHLAFLRGAETVAVFRALCTLTRIETSRLGDDGSEFGDLAGEVRPLSERIQSTGKAILDAATRLDQSVESVLRKESELAAGEVQQLESLIAGVHESLRAFEDRLERARQASECQFAQHRAIREAMEDLVQSLQFHDITRQQIEHVCQALLGIEPGARSVGRSGNGPDSGVRAILSLQASQLAGAQATFSRSFGQMERDLEGMAARVHEMAEVSRGLLGSSGGEQEAFFQHMEASLSGILRTMGACEGAESATRATAGELAATVRGIRVAIEEIRGVEIQIQRVAVNATIRSAHIGAPGDALMVIADVMHHKALDSNSNTEEVARLLDAIDQAICQAAEGSGAPGSSGDPGTGQVVDRLRESILELHSSSDTSFTRVHQIAALSSRLSDEIQALRNSLTAGPVFSEVLTRVRAELEQAGAELAPVGPRPAPSADLENLTKVYTMQSERDVHRAAASGEPAAAFEGSELKTETFGSIHGDAGAYGDNVELF